MKKFIALLVMASMFTLTSCGDKPEEESTDISTADNSISESQVIDDSEPESSVEKTEEKNEEENFWDFYGLNVLEPANLEKYGFSGELMWGRDAEATEELCFSIMSSMNYAERKGRDTYGLDDVWDILRPELNRHIDHVYSMFNLGEAEVTTTEKVDFLGAEFIHSTGSIPLETFEHEKLNIYYAAYYGILDFPAHEYWSEDKGVPVMFISFSDSDSDETKAEMNKIVDDVAKNACWLEE